MKIRLPQIIAYSLSAMILFSCTEDYFDFDKLKVEPINPELALPLINSSLSPADIFTAEDDIEVLKNRSRWTNYHFLQQRCIHY